jgi:N-acyl-D-amino-acid deacylase
MTPDLVVRNGTVFDGLGSPGVAADVAVHGGKIADIGRISSSGQREIDASGKYVTPGFIDIHSHSDFTLLVDPRAVSSISQGVTLEVIGNCGHGCFPLVDKALARNSIYGISDAVPLDWSTSTEYLDRLEAVGPAVNVATLVPNGQLRQASTGLKEGPADKDEIRLMCRHLEEGLEAGAFGYSTGLEYAVEMGAGRDEIAALLRPVAKRDLIYATHTRQRDEHALEAVEEALETARNAGVRLQISHLLPRGGRSDHEACIEAVEKSRDEDQDVAFDMHTRKFSMTFLHAMLPPWALEGGLGGLQALISSDEVRARIHAHRSIVTGGGWEQVTLLDNQTVPQYARMDFGAIGREMGMAPADAALELLCRSAQAATPLMVIRPVYSDVDQELAFGHDLCVPGSDATALCPEGPLAGSAFHGAYSWASWFFRFSVHERKFLAPKAAIHKLCGQPAHILKLDGRGVLAKNACADIAVFDPDTFGERATLWAPNQKASGMAYVIVNGRLALDDYEITDHRAGQVIRKQ